MRLLAEGDRARAREDKVDLVVPLMQVRRPLGDLDVDVGNAALAARDDPLGMAGQSMGCVWSQ